MIINNAKYELTAVKPEQYPVSHLPEIAFVGRSNVGKSSIINSLANRKSMARVGATPGMTREINFYNIDEKLYFVDLPGYGYASVSKSQKLDWGKVIETYLSTRNQLRLIIHLVDIRHEPTKDDVQMNQWLVHSNAPYIIVATKSDKISRSQVNVRLKEISKALELGVDTKVLPYSSENRHGKEELLKEIEARVT